MAVGDSYFQEPWTTRGDFMTLLNRKVDYALLILSFLYQKTGGGCAREIAGKFGLSRAFVANILKELCHKGFVTSHRGVKGGYVLQRSPDQVNLAELMDALDESFRFAECNHLIPDDGCSLTHVCPVKGPIAEVHQRLRKVLQNVTLAELFRPAFPSDHLQIGIRSLGAEVSEDGIVLLTPSP
jgi:Rrf2 family protein